MFKIGEFSKLSGLSIDTLYHYEKMKLLIPVTVDKFTGYRGYDASQLVTVNKLLALKDAGFSLEEIAAFLNNNPVTSLLIKTLEEKAFLLEKEINSERKRLERLHTNIFLIKNGGIPLVNEITIKRVEPILVASIRRKFNKDRFNSELERMWIDINGYINENGGKRSIPCMMIYHKGWTNLKNWTNTGSESLDIEVIEPLIKPIVNNETVRIYELPATPKMACVIHKGTFSTICVTNEYLYNWIKENGYVVAGEMREIYHKGEWETENPDEYITELQIPLV